MGIVPIVLVLTAAGAHAGWNLIAKRAGGGVTFVWLCPLFGLALFTPAAAVQVLLRQRGVSFVGLVFIVGSGVLHAGYFSSLQEGYAAGDLSLVYPLARGTGPVLSVIAAIVILGEHAAPLTLLGAGLVVVAILSLTRGAWRGESGRAICLAGLTGAFTAAYTVWDAHAVTALHQPVIVYFWGAEATRTLLLTPIVARRGVSLRDTWIAHGRQSLGVGLLSPAAYVLILAALTTAPVIFVAPAREISVVLGVLAGAHLLGEGRVLQRTLAAVAVLIGVVLLALG